MPTFQHYSMSCLLFQAKAMELDFRYQKLPAFICIFQLY